jgi:hypothetical protein
VPVFTVYPRADEQGHRTTTFQIDRIAHRASNPHRKPQKKQLPPAMITATMAQSKGMEIMSRTPHARSAPGALPRS